MNERDYRRRVRAVLGEPPGHAGAVQRLEGRRSYVAGFVSLRSGDFAEDRSARLDKLPNSEERVTFPATYDPVARRWLRVPSTAVAPDHRSYAFVKARADTSQPSVWELRVFELDSMRDRLVWSSPGEIGHVTWSGDGIEFATAPPRGGDFTQAWRIAPRGGGAREIPLPPWARPIEWGGPDWIRAPLPFHDAGGRWVLVEEHGTTNRGINFDFSMYSLVGPGGQRAQVWSGANPSAANPYKAFNPLSWFLDGDRLWIGSTSADDVIYLWTAQDGLERFPVKPKWDAMLVVGPCV